uniref:Uncharacterized protein n=1 Tax=Dulem virus 42 TaxID=3145760 RepID=A0AAU8B910_9CAUD
MNYLNYRYGAKLIGMMARYQMTVCRHFHFNYGKR